MIKQIFSDEEFNFDCLMQNCYTRMIKAHYNSYGIKYDFCRFFKIVGAEELAIISLYNSSMLVALVDNFTPNNEFFNDIILFIQMNKPERVDVDNLISKWISNSISDDYSAEKRTEFVLKGDFSVSSIEVNEFPKLDDVFNILSESFPQLKNSYYLWLTDTSHRIRRGVSQTFLVKNFTTATIQYKIDNIALIGQVATLPEFRGNHNARELIYWISNRLLKEGFAVHLFARENRVSYYEEIGFLPISTDIVFERKFIDE